MNRKELEDCVFYLDEAVERMASLNCEADVELVPEDVLENIQRVISKLELELTYCDSYEEESSYEEDDAEALSF